MWSKQLQELSKVYFEFDGTHCKSTSGNFGILRIDEKNQIYTISLKQDLNIDLTFNSVDEMIKAGWAVD